MTRPRGQRSRPPAECRHDPRHSTPASHYIRHNAGVDHELIYRLNVHFTCHCRQDLSSTCYLIVIRVTIEFALAISNIHSLMPRCRNSHIYHDKYSNSDIEEMRSGYEGPRRYRPSRRERSDASAPDGSISARSLRNSGRRGYISSNTAAGTRESLAR